MPYLYPHTPHTKSERINSMNPLEHIMGVNEAAELWGLSPGTIKNYCAEGRVKSVKIEGRWILDRNQPNPSQPEHPKNWRGKKLD